MFSTFVSEKSGTYVVFQWIRSMSILRGVSIQYSYIARSTVNSIPLNFNENFHQSLLPMFFDREHFTYLYSLFQGRTYFMFYTFD